MTFELPTQVLFVDEEGEVQAGIATGDTIICLCCGGVLEVNEVLEYGPIKVLEWISLKDECRGDEVLS